MEGFKPLSTGASTFKECRKYRRDSGFCRWLLSFNHFHHTVLLFSGVEDQKNVEVPHGFELGTVVEAPGPKGDSIFGAIRWIGYLPQVKDHLFVGLELVRKGIIL